MAKCTICGNSAGWMWSVCQKCIDESKIVRRTDGEGLREGEALRAELAALKAQTPFLSKCLFYLACFILWGASQEGGLESMLSALIWVAFPLVVAAGVIQHWSDKKVQSKRDEITRKIMVAMKGPKKAFFVYLRPFVVTARMEYSPTSALQPPSEDLEEELTRSLAQYGPLIGLGKPNETSGATRFEVEEGAWKESVLSYMHEAQLIFMVPAYHEGTKWEMAQILKHGYMKKTIFIVPVGSSLLFDPKTHWEQTGKDWHASFGFTLPPYGKTSTLFQLSVDGQVMSEFSMEKGKFDNELVHKLGRQAPT